MSKKNISLSGLTAYLNSYLDPLKIDEKSCNGVQVSNQAPIETIATAVSASYEAIEKAAALGAQALIVHHGIFLKGEATLITDSTYRKIKKLIEHNIALMCYHLPLDAHREIGNNWKAAKDLELHSLEPFLEYCKIPIGVIGVMKAIPFDEFKKKVERYYGRPAQAVKVKDSISKVAIVSGGAEKFVKHAALAGADCYITGRVDEPVWDSAHEENISFLSLGHYGTETVGPRALAAHLHEKFSISCTFIKTDNPF